MLFRLVLPQSLRPLVFAIWTRSATDPRHSLVGSTQLRLGSAVTSACTLVTIFSLCVVVHDSYWVSRVSSSPRFEVDQVPDAADGRRSSLIGLRERCGAGAVDDAESCERRKMKPARA